MSVTTRFALLTLMAASFASSVGCVGLDYSATLGPFGVPVPVSPYFQKRHEDAFWDEERYMRAPILDSLPEAGVAALDPPSDDEVMRALERARPVQGGTPLLWERQRNNVRIHKELIQDSIDPVRFVPGVGPVQLHHAHYKCTVYFTEITRPGWPLPHTTIDEDTREVVYIDHDHFHLVGSEYDLNCP